MAVLAAFFVIACDSPARVKPWRHAPDPTTEAQNEPSSPALVDVSNTAEVRANRGHTLRIHVDADPVRLNPLVTPTVWGRRITMGTVFEPLVRYLPPEPGQTAGRFAPRLARSWRVMPSQTEIRIELEPGCTFHDGRPVTSSDVQFTLDAIRDPRRGVDHLRAMLSDVFAVELITSHEVRLVLNRPSGYVLRALAEIPILPMNIYEGSLLAGGALVGSGPYKLASNKSGVVHLVRNEKYWGPKPAIKDIEYVFQPDAAIALKDAKRGDIDIVPALISAHWPEQASAPGMSQFSALDLGGLRIRYLRFNAEHVPLDDPRVRHALALLVDRRTIAKRAFDGLARPALWPIWPGGFANGPELAIPEFDPAGAAKLLDEAGWTDSDKDGIRDNAAKKQLRLVMLATDRPPQKDVSSPAPKLARDYFVEAARKMGVVIEVREGSSDYLAKRIAEGNYDIVEMSHNGMVDMDLAPLVGSQLPQRGSAPRVDRALDAFAAAWDPAQRAKLATDLHAALLEAWPIAGIVADAPQGLVHKRVHGLHVWDGWFDVASLSLSAE